MFLKTLKIENNGLLIRDLPFHKGINLIVDESITQDKKESGNNVGKTTVLRLIDFCLGSDGRNIYQDPEFKNKSNTQIEQFLKNNNVIITLILKEDLEDANSSEIVIKRNFLQYSKKIQEINNESYNDDTFSQRLKKLIFNSDAEKPKFRQIIAKNVRDEKSKLVNTVKVLHLCTRQDEYEALYLFWLGIELDTNARKQKLLQEQALEQKFENRLKEESSLSLINQSLLIIDRNIKELEKKRNSFNVNEKYEVDLTKLNLIKLKVNKLSTEYSRLEMRKELINDSKINLEKELSQIDTKQIKNLYEEAKVLIPQIQKTFEDTLNFHNRMIAEKIKYISRELPELEAELISVKREMSALLLQEKNLTDSLKKSGAIEEMQQIILELNEAFEKKGKLEEQKRLIEESQNKLKAIGDQIEEINKGILSKDDLIQQRVAEFNKYFSDISFRLYGERFVVSADRNEKGYELNISSISGNLGTGKKKGQIAAFDLAYIQFADSLSIKCLHFILHDQIENVHDNQISSLLTEIVNGVNCQYVVPVLRDKLPKDIDIKQYEILSLSEKDKLFKVK
ncbi:MAG: hypothetical protein A2Y10_03705 [Planctomycetes bacterium GWF2_41_51]|nr:MAG: hypothetical protein A2Y10_03705 [Planctomycetes bacterium GWF2_41_51]HBG28849.1 DUF2326 domain-containing protein [Phycisphaerales bacterium]